MMIDTFELRPAEAGDVPAIEALVEAAYAGYVPRIGQKPGPMLDDYAALVRDGLVQVSVQDGRIEGVLVLMEKADHLLLDNIAVTPTSQGKGVGRRLIEVAEQTARTLGYNSLHLYTNEAMIENIALYERLGFSITQRATERGLNRVYMSKPIA